MDRAGTVATSAWSAPGRVTLVGDHTDHDGGLSLPFALPLRTVVRARPRADATVRATSAVVPGEPVELSRPVARGEVEGWGAYVAGVVRVLTHSGVEVPGADLRVESAVPPGAGLSSSHALVLAVAGALADLAGATLSREDLVELARRVENDEVGVPSGVLDQLAILSARRDRLVLVDAAEDAPARTSLVACDPVGADLVILVVDTGAPHDLGDGRYAEIRADLDRVRGRLGVGSLRRFADRLGPERALEELADLGVGAREAGRSRHVITENARVAEAVRRCRAGDLAGVGPVMSASHVSMRDDLGNSHPVVDLTVDTLVSAGALGARMSGGGFGGAVVALLARERVGEAESRLTEAYAAAGLAPPGCHRVTPADGAGPVD
ncbi:galactokinase [Nocardioidaceae bacterium]|nr:galactokinase [Nocardioidaceae bacterium]